MILINVLPPEFRKRDTGVSPVFLAGLLSVLANLAILAVFVYIHWIRIPATEEHRDTRNAFKTARQAEAAKVEKTRRAIAAAKTMRKTLFDLLGQKVYQARTLDEFITLMASDSFDPGFMVSVNNLSVSPVQQGGGRNRRPQAEQSELQEILWRWDLKIVGEQGDMSGDYIRSFFRTVENSSFWSKNLFRGDPEATYFGDTTEELEDIERISLTIPIEWKRIVPPVEFVSSKEVEGPGAAAVVGEEG